jgi:hypothetical protein
MKLGISTVKVQNILSHNSVGLRTENTVVCDATVFTSVMEALNDTEHCSSKTDGDIWMKLISYGIHIKGYQTTHKTLL